MRAADPSDMLGAIARLAEDASSGYSAGLGAGDLPDVQDVTAVAFCGMGGSAVAGDVARIVYRDRLAVPLEVVRSPQLPAYVGRRTLVLCSSYSGTTAETLACFDEAVARGARVIAITSGGALAERAGSRGLAVVPVPGGSQPRAALGHLAFGAIGALQGVGLLPDLREDVDDAASVLASLAESLGADVTAAHNPAKAIASRIGQRVPVVWGGEGIGALAAARWKTQFNENAKIPAFASALPELDHNEVVGWSQDQGRPFCILRLRTGFETHDISARFPLSAEIAKASGARLHEIEATGHLALAQFASLTITGDYASAYLGLARGVDPTPVAAIDRLKEALADA